MDEVEESMSELGEDSFEMHLLEQDSQITTNYQYSLLDDSSDCPFCGCTALAVWWDEDCEGSRRFYMQCGRCGAHGPVSDSYEDAAMAWEMRE